VSALLVARCRQLALAGLTLAAACGGSSSDDQNFTMSDPTLPADSSSGPPATDGGTAGGGTAGGDTTGGGTTGGGTTDGGTTAGSDTTEGTSTGTTATTGGTSTG
jgi:hypothetical protein